MLHCLTLSETVEEPPEYVARKKKRVSLLALVSSLLELYLDVCCFSSVAEKITNQITMCTFPLL